MCRCAEIDDSEIAILHVDLSLGALFWGEVMLSDPVHVFGANGTAEIKGFLELLTYKNCRTCKDAFYINLLTHMSCTKSRTHRSGRCITFGGNG